MPGSDTPTRDPRPSRPDPQSKPPRPSAAQQDDDVVGKAYDSRLMRRLITYLYPYKWACIASIVAIILKAGADVLGPWLTMVAVDLYLTPAVQPNPRQAAAWAARGVQGHPWISHWLSPYASGGAVHGVTQLAMTWLVALVLSYALEALQTWLMQWTGQKVMFDLRSQIFRRLQEMHIGFFDRNPVGRLVTRLTTDVDALNEMFTSGVFAIFEDVFVLAGIVFVMLRMKWWLALAAFSVLPFILLVTRIFRKYVRDSYRRIRAAIARINAFTQEYISGMPLVQLFNRQQRAFRDFSAINKIHLEAFKDNILAYALYYPAVEFLSSFAIALIIWLGGGGVLRGTVLLGTLVGFMQYAQRFFRPIQDLSEKYNILQAAMAASERVFKLLDTPPEIVSPPNPTPGDRSGRIQFRDVWFTYQRLDPETTARIDAATPPELEAMTHIEWVMRGVSFTLSPNHTAAIVGHTGAGKTTITSLMMRFYDVQHGQVLVDGVDVRQQDLTALRQRFGVVLQDPFLFTGTVADNIRLGTEYITDEDMHEAAEQVNVDDFIRTLPGAYAEPLRERGAGLSTGQKQLINFARALAHRPGILILDEATSSVDTDTEFRVRAALERMVEGRTSVVIAHRLSTVQRADVILVMHRGQLREMGTHQELLALHGIYWKLYQLQYQDQELGEPPAGLTPSLALGTD
ncbi:MAG TPA: ABC transporter ATP-binding protein [Acidobacteriaceae bacterium]|jgi:ATP-binding cassette subfamily B protein|nr:ABC transporter ATP-binding protein [Acidobacteriaceae bacterium]